MPKLSILATNRGVDLFSRNRSRMEQTTHQEKAASNHIKARKFLAILRSLLWLEIGDNLLNSFLSQTGGSSQIPKVMPEHVLYLIMYFNKTTNVTLNCFQILGDQQKQHKNRQEDTETFISRPSLPGMLLPPTQIQSISGWETPPRNEKYLRRQRINHFYKISLLLGS